jgi:hypothetical protein
MTGTAVFRIVVSSDSIKNATATSHGRSCLLEVASGGEEALMRCVPKLAQAPRWVPRRSIYPTLSRGAAAGS